MDYIDLKFRFDKDLSDKTYGEKLLQLLDKYDVEIGYVGYYEPINTPFSRDGFMNMWGVEQDGMSDFFARLHKRKSFLLINPCYDGPASVYISLSLSKSHYNDRPNRWLTLFKAMCIELKPYRADMCMDHSSKSSFYDYDRENFWFLKPEEVSWFNYWSDDLLASGDATDIDAFEWFGRERIESGCFYQLTEQMDAPDMEARVEEARIMLGEGLLLKRELVEEDDVDWDDTFDG
ncbi:hypothetical protein A6395_00730 [Exiguobacterium sp. SH31]|uniref:hypothetical protein n=1 Tax=unclassified Exiguobacterium TaxID=2644629 RepID=UPI0008CEB288|nr:MULTISPECIES: hypothetical protein [unclassified Exiguobacterium]OGX80613.1 hypothetical protein A6395_00730 [Exiguobacterium sp. SH31]TCI69799.1 hypothetical protein EVJ22_09650 [Exiguobacterium sp. SH0S7]